MLIILTRIGQRKFVYKTHLTPKGKSIRLNSSGRSNKDHETCRNERLLLDSQRMIGNIRGW